MMSVHIGLHLHLHVPEPPGADVHRARVDIKPACLRIFYRPRTWKIILWICGVDMNLKM